MRRFFRFLREDATPSAIEAEKALIKECRKVLRWKGAMPMARFFAGVRLGEASSRLAALQAQQDRADADAALRESMRRRFAPAGNPLDPISRAEADDPTKPLALGHSAPPLPVAACWAPKPPLKV
nr:hypothetical protein [Methylobacterium sp. ZNC0032]